MIIRGGHEKATKKLITDNGAVRVAGHCSFTSFRILGNAMASGAGRGVGCKANSGGVTLDTDANWSLRVLVAMLVVACHGCTVPLFVRILTLTWHERIRGRIRPWGRAPYFCHLFCRGWLV